MLLRAAMTRLSSTGLLVSCRRASLDRAKLYQLGLQAALTHSTRNELHTPGCAFPLKKHSLPVTTKAVVDG